MSRLSSDQVLALAPDASAVAAARELANAGKWVSAGADEAAVWGEAIGSGQNPYQTAIDLKNLAYKCSCPSRKLPCKHAVGLLMRHAKGEVRGGSPPGWVQEWLDKRAERSVRRAERATSAPASPDPEAAARRSDKRWTNILAGIDECESFLEDAVAQGLLAVQSARTWDQMAARMVDAQAPGVAARLKRLGAGVGVGDTWGAVAAGQLGSLSLLLEAARRVDSLDEGLRCDVRTSIGIPMRREDLASETIVDVWDVLGQIVEIEDRVSTCRSWLKARTTGQWAMHLAFSVAGQPYDFRPIPGAALAAEVQFFPSAWPLRVSLGVREMVPFHPDGGLRLSDCLGFASRVWAVNPWVEQVPVHLSGASLGNQGTAWFVLDDVGHAVHLRGNEPWGLLAMTGNQPCQLHGEWNGTSLRLLGAWGAWGYLAL